MKALAEMVTSLSALLTVLSSWELCALKLIGKHRPSSVSFICTAADHCPSNDLYKMMRTPFQTLLGLETDEMPMFLDSDLVFLPIHGDDIEWKNETIWKYLRGGQNFFKIVIVASMRNSPENDNEFMSVLFKDMWKSGIVNGAVLLKNGSTSIMFTYIPFKSIDSCEDTSPVMLGNCDDVVEAVFDSTYKVVNLNSCNLTVSIADDAPWLEVHPYRGRLRPLLEEISSRMNFTASIIWPNEGVNGGVCPPDELTGTKGDVASGKAHIAAGTFNGRECSIMEYINIPYTTCLSFCVPLVTAKDYIYTFLVGIFQSNVWAALIGSVCIVVISIIILCHVTDHQRSSHNFMYLILVLFAPVPLNYRSYRVRMVLGMWLCVCLVIRTAYEGELKSQSAVPMTTHVIKSYKGIVERVKRKKFKKICATLGSLGTLKTIDDPNIHYLYKAASTCKDGMYANIVKAALKKDRAIFTTDQRCRAVDAEIGNGSPLLHAQTGGCTKMIHMAPFLTWPGSPFRKTIGRIQHWTFDNGLFIKWTDTAPSKQRLATEEVQALSLQHVLPVMFVLCLGCSVGLVIFLVEIGNTWLPVVCAKLTIRFSTSRISRASKCLMVSEQKAMKLKKPPQRLDDKNNELGINGKGILYDRNFFKLERNERTATKSLVTKEVEF